MRLNKDKMKSLGSVRLAETQWTKFRVYMDIIQLTAIDEKKFRKRRSEHPLFVGQILVGHLLVGHMY